MPIELHEELERPQIVRLVVVLAFVSDERVLQHIGAPSAFLWLFLSLRESGPAHNFCDTNWGRRSHISVQLDNNEGKRTTRVKEKRRRRSGLFSLLASHIQVLEHITKR
jgi:hypothetical protein